MGAHTRARSARRGLFIGIRRRVFSRRQPPKRTVRGRDVGNVIGVAVLVAGLALAALIVRSRANHQHRAPRPAATATPIPSILDVVWDDAWPRLAFTGFPARSLDHIKAAYAFAARRPDVLQSLPCFCGCARQGHRSNEACYVTGRSASGVPRWTDHAITCGMCVDITHDAIVMTADHQLVDAIRRAIEMKYQPR